MKHLSPPRTLGVATPLCTNGEKGDAFRRTVGGVPILSQCRYQTLVHSMVNIPFRFGRGACFPDDMPNRVSLDRILAGGS